MNSEISVVIVVLIGVELIFSSSEDLYGGNLLVFKRISSGLYSPSLIVVYFFLTSPVLLLSHVCINLFARFPHIHKVVVNFFHE